MDFKLVYSETEEIIFTGQSIPSSSIDQISKKRYKVEFTTEDGQTVTRYTNYIDRDDENKVIHIEGMTIKDYKIKNIDDSYTKQIEPIMKGCRLK